MKFIVGLGNPGDVYIGTRHNVGFMLLDQLSSELGLQSFVLKKKLNSLVGKVNDLVFIKPQTFMNGSGFGVEAVLKFYKQKNNAGYQNLLVIHDDLDLDLGNYKIQYGKGPQAHNGLLSIYQHLRTKNFWHIRVGIDTRMSDRRVSSPVYVLQRFNNEQQAKLKLVKQAIIKEIKLMIESK